MNNQYNIAWSSQEYVTALKYAIWHAYRLFRVSSDNVFQWTEEVTSFAIFADIEDVNLSHSQYQVYTTFHGWRERVGPGQTNSVEIGFGV